MGGTAAKELPSHAFLEPERKCCLGEPSGCGELSRIISEADEGATEIVNDPPGCGEHDLAILALLTDTFGDDAADMVDVNDLGVSGSEELTPETALFTAADNELKLAPRF